MIQVRITHFNFNQATLMAIMIANKIIGSPESRSRCECTIIKSIFVENIRNPNVIALRIKLCAITDGLCAKMFGYPLGGPTYHSIFDSCSSSESNQPRPQHLMKSIAPIRCTFFKRTIIVLYVEIFMVY